MKEIIDNLKDLLGKIEKTAEILDLKKMRGERGILEAKMNEPDFWNDNETAQKVSKEFDDMNNEIQTWDTITQEVKDQLELANMAEKENDKKIQKDVKNKYDMLLKNFDDLEFRVLLGREYDKNNAIVAIHAGTGGVDAQDWSGMLKRMLLRYCEKRGLTTKVVDESRGGEAGIKSVVFEVSGLYAYGYLKSEAGVHRLVRISPFDAEAMRHTSFALVEVLPELGEVEEVVIKEDDLKIDTYKASGAGGQHVNKTDSAVRIVHKPSGISVSCQNERSQHQNRESAMKYLKAKLHKVYLEEKQQEEQKIRGEYTSAEWGNQIRSYVLHPYKMVKDHRTKYEEKDPEAVLDGELTGFAEAYLKDKKFNKM